MFDIIYHGINRLNNRFVLTTVSRNADLVAGKLDMSKGYKSGWTDLAVNTAVTFTENAMDVAGGGFRCVVMRVRAAKLRRVAGRMLR